MARPRCRNPPPPRVFLPPPSPSADDFPALGAASSSSLNARLTGLRLDPAAKEFTPARSLPSAPPEPEPAAPVPMVEAHILASATNTNANSNPGSNPSPSRGKKNWQTLDIDVPFSRASPREPSSSRNPLPHSQPRRPRRKPKKHCHYDPGPPHRTNVLSCDCRECLRDRHKKGKEMVCRCDECHPPGECDCPECDFGRRWVNDIFPGMVGFVGLREGEVIPAMGSGGERETREENKGECGEDWEGYPEAGGEGEEN